MLEALVRRTLHDRLRGTIGWISGLVAIVAVQMSVYPTVRDSTADWQQATASFPEAFKEIFRMEDYTTPAGYLSTELMTFIIPLVFVGLGAGWGSRLTTEDEENHTADVILGLPISRVDYFVARLAAVLLVLVGATLIFWLSLTIGSTSLDMKIGLANLASAASAVLLLGVLGASLAAMIGAISGRRAVALGITLSLVIGLFIVYSLAPLVSIFDRSSWANPWQWTLGSQPITDGISLTGTVATTVLAGSMFALAARAFARRDITN